MFSTHVIDRFRAGEAFSQIFNQAQRRAWLARLFGRRRQLLCYAAATGGATLPRRDLGIVSIPTRQIKGTVGRQYDFDGDFRPLKMHLRDRWIGVALSAATTGWPPVELLKLDDVYFVQDGHHRVSYARRVNMPCIEAHVWEVRRPLPRAAPPRRRRQLKPACCC